MGNRSIFFYYYYLNEFYIRTEWKRLFDETVWFAESEIPLSAIFNIIFFCFSHLIRTRACSRETMFSIPLRFVIRLNNKIQ